MKHLNYLIPLMMLFNFLSCNMFGQKSPECGGVVYNVRKTKPLNNVSGTISNISFSLYNGEWNREQFPLTLDFDLKDGVFSGSVCRDLDYESYKFEYDADAEMVGKLSNLLKESGIMEFNNWNVVVAGLPPIYDVNISANFTSKEHLYINFNGGRDPVGFNECLQKFVLSICELVDYDPEKCPKAKPYVSPYVGTHHFVYNKNGKHQDFTFIVEPKGSPDGNAEVISDGDFGYVHLRCAANKVSGKYHFDVLRHYDDSKVRDVTKNSLAGIISMQKDVFFLEPLQACPDLPDRSLLEQEK